MNVSESYTCNSDVQPNLEAKYLEQMDSSNTRMSYEQDILLFNFWLTKSGISWTKTSHTRLCLFFNCKLMKIIQDKLKVEPHIFTSNQFGSPPLTLLNETACITCKSRNYIETRRHDKVFNSGLLSKMNIFQ